MLLFNSCLPALNPPFITLLAMLSARFGHYISPLPARLLYGFINRRRQEGWRREKGPVPSPRWHLSHKTPPQQNKGFQPPHSLPHLHPQPPALAGGSVSSCLQHSQNQPMCFTITSTHQGCPLMRGLRPKSMGPSSQLLGWDKHMLFPSIPQL